MKFFLDTAVYEEIAERDQTGLIDGITTNPTLILKSGGDPVETIRKISEDFPHFESISAEVVANTAPDMIDQAQVFKEMKNVTIKVPCTVEGLKACKALAGDGFTVNVTLCFSVAQAILAAKADATYISPFVGRVDDNSFDGVRLVQDIANLYKEHMSRTQVLAASLRNVADVAKCFSVGSDVVTMPPAIFDKMYKHILTDKGLELFQNDWESINNYSPTDNG
jgi:transaldolase|tara:strand:- start:110 stop:778 length:669 start_codon:yes stop_codon:yes gene_type:complete